MEFKMKYCYLALLLNFFIANVFADTLKVSENIEVYSGDKNLKVSVVRILPLESNKALLMVSGIDHELNKIVFEYDIATDGGHRRFKTQLAGRDYYALVESSRWGSKYQTFHLPNSKANEEIYLSFDEELSSKADAQELLKKHLKQESEGLLAKLQEFNRENENSNVSKKLEKQQTIINETCPNPITLSIDLDSISDDVIKKYSVALYCGNAFDQVVRLCKSDESKTWVTSNINSIECRFGQKLRLRLDDKKLHYQTYPEGPNQRDFVKQNLINIM